MAICDSRVLIVGSATGAAVTICNDLMSTYGWWVIAVMFGELWPETPLDCGSGVDCGTVGDIQSCGSSV